MSTFADKLTNAVREGQKKRKRLEEFERDSLKGKLKKEWNSFSKVTLEEAESSGRTCYIMPLDFKKNQEYQPTNKDLIENLPKDLKEMRNTEGCSVRLEYGSDGAHTWDVIVCCTGRVNALNDKEREADEEEEAADRAS
tara:strand:- start:3904 stop:4320 length:417 start_codon:yes stop_codon:yes gene_type:complete